MTEIEKSDAGGKKPRKKTLPPIGSAAWYGLNAWNKFAREVNAKQTTLSVTLGKSRSFINQKLHDRLPMGDGDMIHIAHALRQLPQDIFPLHWQYAYMTTGKISEIEYKLVVYFRELKDDDSRAEALNDIKCKAFAQFQSAQDIAPMG